VIDGTSTPLWYGLRVADFFLKAAIDEAKVGWAEGGIPIGSILVIEGAIVGRGHNRRVQMSSPILHAEMDCLANAGRLKSRDYRRATLYSTLSPCDMCAGAILLYEIPRVVIGENRTFRGPEGYLKSRGVLLDLRDDEECYQLMNYFVARHPDIWYEDIGLPIQT
jgi:cytosine/creatinine deaminase